jgi:hypothetical protein
MNETKLLSSLLPGHPDFQHILQNIREKYDIPEIIPEDVGIKIIPNLSLTESIRLIAYNLEIPLLDY